MDFPTPCGVLPPLVLAGGEEGRGGEEGSLSLSPSPSYPCDIFLPCEEELGTTGANISQCRCSPERARMNAPERLCLGVFPQREGGEREGQGGCLCANPHTGREVTSTSPFLATLVGPPQPPPQPH